MPDGFIDFIRGASLMAELGIAVSYYKNWKVTEDGLFGFFSLAFFFLALSHLAVLFYGETGEFGPYAYLLRMIAFILIIMGIVGKNLPKRSSKDS